MENFSQKKVLPPILIIEGFWGVGKTTLIKAVQTLSPWTRLLIEEPNHVKEKCLTNIKTWYRRQHLVNWKRAIDETRQNGHVVLERSILSSIAFSYALHGKLPHWADPAIRRIKNSRTDFKVIFLYGTNTFLKTRIKTLSDQTVISATDTQPKFLSNYLRFYKRVLPDRFRILPLFIYIDEKSAFRKKREIYLDLARFFPNMETKNDVCAACIAYYKNKILLLYDKAYKHYVLPQGHKKMGERLRLTALRELQEETGFTDTSVLKKIISYQYCYPNGQFIIRKKIHVYLLRIHSLKKQPKSLEAHENYRNTFVDKSKAAARLRWKQDKKIIGMSLPYMK